MGLDSNLKFWLEEHKMIVSPKTTKEKTHNVMEFGKFLSIRPDKFDDFLRKLSKTLKKGKVNFLLELRTEYFKFMVDVDFKTELGLTSEEKERMLKTINEAVNDCVGDQLKTNEVIISSCTDEKIKYKDKEHMIKVGFHLIWPNLIVGVDEALYLRSAIIQKLDQENSDLLSIGDWDDIIDNAIYRPNHALRMNGSNKNVVCPRCKNKQKLRPECDYCDSKGKMDKGRVYKPVLILNKDNEEDTELLNILTNSFYENLKRTSIRTDAYESNINIKNYPIWFSKNKLDSHLKRSKKEIHTKKIIKDRIKLKNKNPFKSNLNDQEIEDNDIRYQEITEYLISEGYKLSPYFKDLEFNKFIKRSSKNSKKIYYILGTKSYFCLNMNREHGSNHIYFYITKKQIVQKCHSPWYNKNKICCDKFSSRPLPLNKKISNILFGTKKEEKVENMETKTKQLLISILND